MGRHPFYDKSNLSIIYVLYKPYRNVYIRIYVYTSLSPTLSHTHTILQRYVTVQIDQSILSIVLSRVSQPARGNRQIIITGFRSPEAPVQSMYTIYSLHQGSIATYLGCSIYMSIVRRRQFSEQEFIQLYSCSILSAVFRCNSTERLSDV